jgi:hypothetical protein
MSAEHDRLAEWDAAYVLGALSPGDRREFEDHLAGCEECRRAVSELAPTTGLLARLAPERARALDGADLRGPGDRVRENVVALAGRERRRRRRLWTTVVAAAAGVAIVGAVAVPAVLDAAAPRSAEHALQDLAGIPLEASVRLTTVEWGTRIDLVCAYTGEMLDAPEEGWPYALAVVGDDGGTTTLSTWRAAPGTETRLSAGTDLSVDDIGAVEIRTIDGEDVLLRYDATRG